MKNWYVRTFLSMLLMQSKNNSDIELLRALHSCNSKNIRNSLIFLQKMAPYSCFWRVPSSKILLQASLQEDFRTWDPDIRKTEYYSLAIA